MADKSSREIERDLENQRDELRGTIEEALNRMTLEGAWSYAGRYLRENRGAYGQTVGSVIKEKPLAVGLVAIGMAWIMFGPSNVARQAAREDRYGRDDGRGDTQTRRRLEAGDFDDTTARGPTGREARPDPWAAPSRTPSPSPASTGTGTGSGSLGSTSSPTTSTSTNPAGSSTTGTSTTTSSGTTSSSTGTSGGAHSTRGTGDTPVAAPAVVPASAPTSSTGSTSTGSTGSGTGTGSSGTSSDTTTTDPKSSKV